MSNDIHSIFWPIASCRTYVYCVKESPKHGCEYISLVLHFLFRPNLVVAHRVCDYCIHDKVTEDSCCVTCGPNRHVFRGYDCAEEFCEWLFNSENMNSTCIAHNFKLSRIIYLI